MKAIFSIMVIFGVYLSTVASYGQPKSPAASENRCVAFEALKIGDNIHNNVRVVRVTPVEVTLSWDGGGRTFKRQDLPAELKEKYPYDPETALVYRRQEAAEAVELGRRQQHQAATEAKSALLRKQGAATAEIHRLRNELELVNAQIRTFDNSGRGRPKVRRRYLAVADQLRQRRIRLLEQIQQQEELLRNIQGQIGKLP